MPQRRTAIKALRINRRRRMRNLDYKTDLRKTLKEFQTSVTAKDKKKAETLLKSLYRKFDKGTKINVLHKNTAARRKSRYTKLLSSIA